MIIKHIGGGSVIANKIYKGVLVKDPTKNSQSNKAKSQSSIELPRSTDVNLVVLEPIKASLVDLDNSKSKNEFVNSDGASTQKARHWSLFSCFRGTSTSKRSTNHDSSWSVLDAFNCIQISQNSAVPENVREQNQEPVKEVASSIQSSLQSCLPSLPSINVPKVNCPAIALPSMDHVSEGCERFASCLGAVGNGLATAAGYAGEALHSIGEYAGPVCLGLGRLICCILTLGGSEQ